MIRAIRVVVGMALGLAAVLGPSWGLFHLLRQGSCGDVAMPTCPDRVGLWIMGLVLSITIVAPIAVLIAGRSGRGGPSVLLVPLLVLIPLGMAAGAVVSLVGVSADPDTRWVGIVIGGITALFALSVVRALLRVRPSPPVRAPAAAVASSSPSSAASAATMTQLAAQLSRVAAARAAADSTAGRGAAPSAAPPRPSTPDALAARLRRLDELRQSGLISPDEHAARRREILDEI